MVLWMPGVLLFSWNTGFQSEKKNLSISNSHSFQFPLLLEEGVRPQQQAPRCVQSGTSESYRCAYFEALLGRHEEQTDEVHFTVRLWRHTEVTQLQCEEQNLKRGDKRSPHLFFPFHFRF